MVQLSIILAWPLTKWLRVLRLAVLPTLALVVGLQAAGVPAGAAGPVSDPPPPQAVNASAETVDKSLISVTRRQLVMAEFLQVKNRLYFF